MGYVNAKDIKRMMVKAGWMHPMDQPIMNIMDRSFSLHDEAEILGLIGNDASDRDRYIPEIWDCDDFSFQLNCYINRELPGKCNGVLIIRTRMDPNNPNRDGYHAVFWYATTDYRVVAIEPQNDQPFTHPFKVVAVFAY